MRDAMVRPPCCDKVGIKKGPWTPEEDLVLVSYIQEHGPGNWKSVPTNTGLKRCSKSCRLRWTNYLRPGIKRGKFTASEEEIIINLQALLGNRWAAIASYLPQRTDNDIKNYWNTHLKKNIKKHQKVINCYVSSSSNAPYSDTVIRNDNHEARVVHTSSIQSAFPISTSVYVSSTENVSRLLESWMKTSPKLQKNKLECISDFTNSSSSSAPAFFNGNQIKIDQEKCPISAYGQEALRSDDNSTSIVNENSSSHATFSKSYNTAIDADENVQLDTGNPPFSFLEKWLLDEPTWQVDLLELSSDYS